MQGRWIALALIAFTLGGCVQRTLTVKSDPPEALLFLNGTEVGRTPFVHDFVWYGTYDVQLRHEGYETLKTRGKLIAPWWQWPPFDLVAELMPIRMKDHQSLSYTMQPLKEVQVDPDALLNRAEAMAPMLESSQHTRQPTSIPLRPATHPTTRRAHHAATTQSSGQ
jgi:hypothetical protein